MANGAQALIESLRREGVTHMFGYAGATICEAVDALKASDIQYTLVRTEQNAGHMASGYARTSGKVVCLKNFFRKKGLETVDCHVLNVNNYAFVFNFKTGES